MSFLTVKDKIKLIFPLLINRKIKIYKHILEIEKESNGRVEELQQAIYTKKSELLKYAFNHIPQYKSIRSEMPSIEEMASDYHSWSQLPLIDRDVILGNEEDFISNIHFKRVWNSTSGSSGKKFRFLTDKSQALWVAAAKNYIRKVLTGEYQPRELVIWGAPRDRVKRSQLLTHFKNKFTGIKTCIAYNINEHSVSQIWKTIDKYKPTMITGYPNILSRVFKDKKLSSRFKVISAGEWLRPEIRTRLVKCVGDDVFDFYGSREMGAIAYECNAHRGLHILSSNVFLEILDEQGKQCEPGEIGEIVVTSLSRRSMPLIRYRIGDFGAYSDKLCSCGSAFPVIEKLAGRTMDVIELLNGKSYAGYFWTHLAREVEGIDQFRLVQNTEGHVEVQVVLEKIYNEHEVIKKLLYEIEERTGCGKDFTIKVVKVLSVNQSGKTGLIVSDYNKKNTI